MIRLVLRSLLLLLATSAACCSAAGAMDRVLMRRDNVEQELVGRIVVRADDGGLLVESRDGTLWAVTPQEQVKVDADAEPFTYYDGPALADVLLKELPPGFETLQTKHYLIFYNTSRAYAQWCGSLFERLYSGFGNYWSNRDFTPTDPPGLLVAFIFADKTSYARYAQRDLGDAVNSIIGYYSLKTNRMTLFDLTGTAGTTQSRGDARQITQTLSRPEAFGTVATIVHEATHQIVFNCGMHKRYAAIPKWLSEGLAVYFESPDLDAAKGWRTIGKVNAPRLATFRASLPKRSSTALVKLLSDDDRLQTLDGYAESWALNYFLINAKPKQFQAYMRTMSEKLPLVADSPEDRLAEFRPPSATTLKRSTKSSCAS
ncbi:MAG: DUF1570 domain-containing protein [Pirellulales bacterium]